MSPEARLSGVFPVVSVPFTESWEVDRHDLARELDWFHQLHVDGVVIGMVSEVLRLDVRQRLDLTELVLELIDGRLPCVVSVASESTPQAVALTQHAREAGAAAVMANPPIANGYAEGQLSRHFREVVEACQEIPMILQDASGYVGRPLSIGMQANLLDEFDEYRVQFKPETPPLGPTISALMSASHGRARVFEGAGGRAIVEGYQRGVVGTMPGPDIPWAILAIWRALQHGDVDRADVLASAVSALLTHASSLDSYIAIEKHLLVKQGIFRAARMLGPTSFEMDPVTCSETDRLFERLRLLMDTAMEEVS